MSQQSVFCLFSTLYITVFVISRDVTINRISGEKKCCNIVVGMWYRPTYHVVNLLVKFMDQTREISMNTFYHGSLSFNLCVWITEDAIIPTHTTSGWLVLFWVRDWNCYLTQMSVFGDVWAAVTFRPLHSFSGATFRYKSDSSLVSWSKQADGLQKRAAILMLNHLSCLHNLMSPKVLQLRQRQPCSMFTIWESTAHNPVHQLDHWLFVFTNQLQPEDLWTHS